MRDSKRDTDVKNRLLNSVGEGEGVEKREPSYTVGGNANSTATMENTVEIP